MSKHDTLLLKVRTKIVTRKGGLWVFEVYMRLEKTNRLKVSISSPLPKIDSSIPNGGKEIFTRI